MDVGFHITAATVDDRTHVVEPHGEIDAATAPELNIALIDAGARARVILDLGDVSFLDSRGLVVILGAQKRLAAGGGSLVTVCPNPFVRRLFEITGVSSLLRVMESRPV